MQLSISPLEVVWITVNVVAIVAVLYNLRMAIADRRAYDALAVDGPSAREVAANGNVRREWIRLFKQLLLLNVVWPSLFTNLDVQIFFGWSSDAEILATLRTIALLSLIVVPFAMLYGSVTDARDRRRLAAFTLSELMTERQAADLRVRSALLDLNRRADAVEQRLDHQDRRVSDEMARTDLHQGAQDIRIDDQSNR